MNFDLERARDETPGCEHVIHFNNAGAGLMPAPVLNAIKDHLDLEANMGGYESAAREWDRIEHFYDAAAQLLNAERDEIAFFDNATRAWDMAFYSLDFKPGDRILTAISEYASNYIAYLQVAQKTGVKIEPIPNDESGTLSVDALRDMMDERVKLISITHVPTNGGLVNPAKEVGKIAEDAGVLYLLDACQSVGQMPIDVKDIGCDILSATGRKYLRGARGTGLLYMKRDLYQRIEPIFLDLHAAEWTSKDEFKIRDDARRFETWEGNWSGKIGLGVAIDYALEWGLENIWERVHKLGELLRVKLSQIPKLEVRDLGSNRCGIVTFTVDGFTADQLKIKMANHKININYSPRNFTRLDMDQRDIDNVVRASVHYYNSEEEIEICADKLSQEIGS